MNEKEESKVGSYFSDSEYKKSESENQIWEEVNNYRSQHLGEEFNIVQPGEFQKNEGSREGLVRPREAVQLFC